MKSSSLMSAFTSTRTRPLLPLILVVLCFALWGFANDVTNPMVKAFGRIYGLTNVQSSFVQMSFYGGYFVMALPAALLNRRMGYRTGIIIGLTLFSCGSLLFYPSVQLGNYVAFLMAYFIMTCGLSFLETSANPLVLSAGSKERATFRLNLAQAFNPIGSLLGIWVSIKLVQERLSPLSTEARKSLGGGEADTILHHDLTVLSTPYIYLGIVLLLLLILFFVFTNKHSFGDETSSVKGMPSLKESVRSLIVDKCYTRGVVAQFFYVGAQIMCWTFIIQYGVRLFTGMGYTEAEGEIMAQKYNLLAMLLFCLSRFLGTAFLRKVRPYRLLSLLSLIAIALLLITIFSTNLVGLIALVVVSGCMSIMFPTIYALALKWTDVHTPLGAAGLVMAILGGSVLPVLQASVMDYAPTDWSISPIHLSFFVPLFSFIVIFWYAVSPRHARP